jgi:hypothetical protein
VRQTRYHDRAPKNVILAIYARATNFADRVRRSTKLSGTTYCTTDGAWRALESIGEDLKRKPIFVDLYNASAFVLDQIWFS